MKDKIVHQSVETEYKGATWVGEWCSFIYDDGRESSDRWLKVFRREPDGTLTDLDAVVSDYDESNAIRAAVCDVRVKEIQREFGIGTSRVRPEASGLLPKPEGYPDTSDDDAMEEVEAARFIINRAWAGEWMGQHRDSYGFYIDNLAIVLNRGFVEARHIVGMLHRHRQVGLNGFILVPWRDERKAYEYWEEKTGHKELEVTDHGGWGCSYCGTASFDSVGEGGVDPSSVPCVKKDTDENGNFTWKVAGK